jgi:hypothetical protein
VQGEACEGHKTAPALNEYVNDNVMAHRPGPRHLLANHPVVPEMGGGSVGVSAQRRLAHHRHHGQAQAMAGGGDEIGVGEREVARCRQPGQSAVTKRKAGPTHGAQDRGRTQPRDTAETGSPDDLLLQKERQD